MKGWGGTLLSAVCAMSVISNAGCVGERAPAPEPAGRPASPTERTSFPAPPAVLRYGVASLPLGLDRHIHSVPQPGILLHNVYETLVCLSRDGRIEPSLAKSWNVSADGLTYTFSLHPDVWFHDGTRFDAHAVKANLDRLADPATGSSDTASLLRGYRAAVVTDLHTVQVRLNGPDPGFPGVMAQGYLGMASPESFEKPGRGERQMRPVGTGPFKFLAAQYVPGKTLVLEKNQDYRWGPASYRPTSLLYFGSGHDPDSSCQKTHLVYDHTGPAYLDQVIFRLIPDPSARATALETGAVDAVDGLPSAEATRLEKMRRYWIAADGGAFHAASRKVNCLTYDARGGSPVLYDAEFR